MPWWGKCAESLGQPAWTSPMVDMGRFECSRGGGLRKLPNSLMRCMGKVATVKWEVKYVHATFERMDEAPWCLVP
jgi:hypothetical protein